MAGSTRAIEQDPHGDVGLIADASGTPTGTISYDPWGVPTLAAVLPPDYRQTLMLFGEAIACRGVVRSIAWLIAVASSLEVFLLVLAFDEDMAVVVGVAVSS